MRYDVRRDKTKGIYTQVPVTDKFVYVPVLKTLQSMFKNKEILEAFELVNRCREGIYEDISDGECIKIHRLFSQDKHALQLQLYYDDLETAIP